MSRTPIFVAGIGYALGESVPIDRALEGRVSSSQLGELHARGFERIAVSAGGPLPLARRAVEALLRDHPVDPAEVDAIVYTTCSYWSDPAASSSAGGGLGPRVVDEVLRPTGLSRAQLRVVFLAESGNLVTAMRVARNLVTVEGRRRVLVLTADAVPAREAEYRAMPSSVAINSDGAAAILLSSEGGALELEGISQVTSSRMLGFVKGQGLQKYLEIIAGIRAATDRLLRDCGTTAEGYAHLLTNNYSLETLGGFADAVGIPRERLFVANVARCAHAFSADPLVSLVDCQAASPPSVGDRLFCLSTGPLTWGAMSLRRC